MLKQKFLKALLVTSVIAVIAITACFGLIACQPEEEHQHTYSTTWNNDATNHWHDASCEHTTEKSDLAAHDTKGANGACSVCGYKPANTEHQHTYAEAWSKDATNHWHAATCEHTTLKQGEAKHDTNGTDGACSVCGYKATVTPPVHEHTYSNDWSKDETNHWHAATCEHTTETKDSAAHDTNGTDGACSVCGYKATPAHEHTFANEWTTNETHHWHAATCDHTDEKKDYAEHDTTNGDCVCGYHVHTFAEAWSKDAINHWHAATCEHTTETKDLAAHNTTGENGACSVCGYNVYAELLAKDGKIINETFDTAQDKLADFNGTYGTTGLYNNYNDKGTADGNYVKVENGKAVMVDTTGGATQIVVDFGLTSGVVEGYFELTLKESGNSWTFVQFGKVGGSEVFGLRTDGGNIKYRVNGGSAVAGDTAITTANTTYRIYFKFDGVAQKITMTIDGKDFVKDLGLGVSELGGFKVVSSDNGSKTADLDNIVIVNDVALADLKTLAKEKLQAVYEAYDLTANYTQNGGDITAAKNTGDTEITAAETKVAIETAYNKAIAAMKAVETDEQIAAAAALAEAKQTALTQLSSHKGGAEKFTQEGNKTAYEAAIAAGTEAINAATSTEGVAEALAAAKAVIDEIYTDDQLVATKYKVTFVNSPVEEQEVVENEKVERPTDPTDADAIFVNWYSDAACTTVFDFNTAITANTKIYAKWEGKLVQVTGSNKYGCSDFSTLTALPGQDTTSDETTSDAYITYHLYDTSGAATASLKDTTMGGYTKALSSDGNSQAKRYIKLHLEKAGTIKVVFYITSNDSGGRWVSIDKDLQNSTASADKSAAETTKNTLKTLECELEAGDWYLNFNKAVYFCEITITINSTSTTLFTGITGEPTTTTYDAAPTAETVDLAGLVLAVKDSEDTVALTADSVKAKISVVVTAPQEEGGAYSITVKYGNYVTYTYDVTVTAQTETEEPGETEEPTEPGETDAE